MKDTARMLRSIWRLARRGCWYGAGRFAAVLVYGMTHRHCKRCRSLKGFNAHQFCTRCQMANFFRAMREEAPE